MAAADSAGVALCRPPTDGWAANDGEKAEVLVVHPGGPLWAAKDEHAWSIPKGEFNPTEEDSEAAARREFNEELAVPLPSGAALFLGSFKAGRKTIWPWLVIVDSPTDTALDYPVGRAFDVDSNLFEMEWPPRSGKTGHFPEVDRGQWVMLDELTAKLHKGQKPLVTRLHDGVRQWLERPDSFSTW